MTGADAALEYVYAQWKAAVSKTIRSNRTAVPTASTWDPGTMLSKFNAAYANTGAFAASTGIVVTPGSMYIHACDQNGQPKMSGSKDVSATDAPVGVPTYNVPGYPGWNGMTYNYLASVTVSDPNHSGRAGSDGSITVNRYFQVTTVPLFQAAIFYENDLEIHPGAKMVVTGLVHTNANLYALGMLAQVQFKQNVSYVGSYTQGSNPAVTHGWDGTNTNGSNTPENINGLYNYYYHTGLYPNLWGDTNPTTTPQAGQLSQVSAAIDPFGGNGKPQDNNGLHKIIEVPDTNAAYSDQVAYNNASLRIVIDPSQTGDARYTITDDSNKALTGADRANVLAALNATPTTTMTDKRELGTELVTSLDMAKLAYATVPTGSLNFPSSGSPEFKPQTFPIGLNSDGTPYGTAYSPGTTFQKNFGGTVYIHYKDKQDNGTAIDTSNMAVRLVNGRSLGQDVSVATDNGLYIQGDYNTGGDGITPVPSNTANGGDPNVAGYTRHSSAVMADAVTILSNSWSDGNAGYDLSHRRASATTVNTAILAGDVPSNADGNGYASGGASWRTGDRRTATRPTSTSPTPARWWRHSTATSSPAPGRPTTFTSGPTACGASTHSSYRSSRPACRQVSSSHVAATNARSTEPPVTSPPPSRHEEHPRRCFGVVGCRRTGPRQPGFHLGYQASITAIPRPGEPVYYRR